MIRVAESAADFEVCASIFADVEPDARVVNERLGYRELPASIVVEGAT